MIVTIHFSLRLSRLSGTDMPSLYCAFISIFELTDTVTPAQKQHCTHLVYYALKTLTIGGFL